MGLGDPRPGPVWLPKARPFRDEEAKVETLESAFLSECSRDVNIGRTLGKLTAKVRKALGKY